MEIKDRVHFYSKYDMTCAIILSKAESFICKTIYSSPQKRALFFIFFIFPILKESSDIKKRLIAIFKILFPVRFFRFLT